MENQSKKEQRENYKNRTQTGGIYYIVCNGNGKRWLKSTKDIQGQKNRFEFFCSTGFCPEPGMRREWEEYGSGSFGFEVVEELIKNDTQTEREFGDEIKLLLELWKERQEE